MRHNNEALKTYKNIHENRQRLIDKELNRITKSENETKSFVKNYYKIRETREMNAREHGKLIAETRNNVLADVLKAIYITALEAESLTDNGLLLAESMVDNYIKEKGGAVAILDPVKNKSYLLARIVNIVEDTTEAEVKDVEGIKDDEDNNAPTAEETPAPASTPEDDEAELVKKVIELGYTVSKDTKAEVPAASESDDMELASGEAPEEKAEEEKEEKSEEKKEDNAPQTDTNEAPDAEVKDAETDDDEMESDFAAEETDDEEESETSEESDEDIDDELDSDSEEDDELDDVTSDGEFNDEDGDGEDDLDVDGDGEDDFGVDEPSDTVNVDPKKTMFQELEKEKGIKDAIEIIRARVADAEQAFINRNAADKEKIDRLLNKISDNIKTVQKISNNDSDESKVAEESALMYKKQINEITNNKPLTIFECMARNITSNILKNNKVKDTYITESGQLDTPMIVEATKVMYGFLETLNTLQIESVDSKYINDILNEFV